MTNLNQISNQVYEANKQKGFDVKQENIGQTLCLIHSEISEALEAIRKDRHANLSRMNFILGDEAVRSEEVHFKSKFQLYIKDTFEDEIADTFIRLMDLVGALNIDIDKHIELKLRYNSMREFKHGKAF